MPDYEYAPESTWLGWYHRATQGDQSQARIVSRVVIMTTRACSRCGEKSGKRRKMVRTTVSQTHRPYTKKDLYFCVGDRKDVCDFRAAVRD